MRRVYVNSALSQRQRIGSPPFDPEGITNVLAWYDADALSLPDLTPIPTWPSTLAAQIDFSQGTTTKQPVLKTNVINGHSAVSFDGIDDTLVSPDLSMTTGNLFFVVRFTSTLPNRRFWSQMSSPWDGALMFSGSDFVAVSSGGGTATPALWTTAASNTWYVLSTEHTASTINLHVNGVSTGTANTGSFYHVIGLCSALYTYAGLYTAADIAMFGIVNGTPLDGSERASVENALMNRFGISA